MDPAVIHKHLTDPGTRLFIMHDRLHLPVNDIDAVQISPHHTAVGHQIVSAVPGSINAVVSDKTKDPRYRTTLSAHLSLVPGVEVHDLDRLGIPDPGILLPCRPGMVRADRELLFCKSGGKCHILQTL